MIPFSALYLFNNLKQINFNIPYHFRQNRSIDTVIDLNSHQWKK
jgi:hypothetical protein